MSIIATLRVFLPNLHGPAYLYDSPTSCALARHRPQGFPSVDLNHLRKVPKLQSLTDEEMVGVRAYLLHRR